MQIFTKRSYVKKDAGEYRENFSDWVRTALLDKDGIEDRIWKIADFVGKLTDQLCEGGVVNGDAVVYELKRYNADECRLVRDDEVE